MKRKIITPKHILNLGRSFKACFDIGKLCANKKSNYKRMCESEKNLINTLYLISNTILRKKSLGSYQRR